MYVTSDAGVFETLRSDETLSKRQLRFAVIGITVDEDSKAVAQDLAPMGSSWSVASGVWSVIFEQRTGTKWGGEKAGCVGGAKGDALTEGENVWKHKPVRWRLLDDAGEPVSDGKKAEKGEDLGHSRRARKGDKEKSKRLPELQRVNDAGIVDKAYKAAKANTSASHAADAGTSVIGALLSSI